jgi:hypothetical protein
LLRKFESGDLRNTKDLEREINKLETPEISSDKRKEEFRGV